jgi:hypothetical protein
LKALPSRHRDVESARRRDLLGHAGEAHESSGDLAGDEPPGEGGRGDHDGRRAQDEVAECVEHPLGLGHAARHLHGSAAVVERPREQPVIDAVDGDGAPHRELVAGGDDAIEVVDGQQDADRGRPHVAVRVDGLDRALPVAADQIVGPSVERPEHLIVETPSAMLAGLGAGLQRSVDFGEQAIGRAHVAEETDGEGGGGREQDGGQDQLDPQAHATRTV